VDILYSRTGSKKGRVCEKNGDMKKCGLYFSTSVKHKKNTGSLDIGLYFRTGMKRTSRGKNLQPL
jgi:hypothetical protein